MGIKLIGQRDSAFVFLGKLGYSYSCSDSHPEDNLFGSLRVGSRQVSSISPDKSPSPERIMKGMNTPLLVPRASLQRLRTSVQLNAHLLALRSADLKSVRYASGKSIGDRRERDQPKKKKKARTVFKQYDLKNAEQFSLCDAMRYGVCLHCRSSVQSLADTAFLATSKRLKSDGHQIPPSTTLQ